MFGNFLNKKGAKKKDIKNEDFRSPEVLGVNLVKDELIVFFDWNKHIFLSILVFVIAALFVFEIHIGLNYWEKQESERAEILRAKTDELKLDVINLNSEHAAALSFRDKSSAFAGLLENHIYWTKFFDWLQKNTINTVTYEGFSGDLTGIYTLKAKAPSYAEASWQAKAFLNSDMVKSVSISAAESSASAQSAEEEIAGDTATGEPKKEEDAGSVSFQIDLEINPELFLVE